jgi:hypothetical protein
VYPSILAGFALARHHFTTAAGDGHAYVLYGLENDSSLSADSIAADCVTAWQASGSWLPNQSNQYTHSDVHVVVNVGGTLSEGDALSGTAGGNVNDPVPPQVALLCQKETNVIGRKGRGRLYIPGLPFAGLDPTNTGLWATGSLPSYTTAADTFLASLEASVGNMVLLHRDASTPTTVTGLTVEQNVATQRRRNRKAAHRH